MMAKAHILALLVRALRALPIGLAVLAASTVSATAVDHSYDRENRYGSVSVNDRDQVGLPLFDRANELNAQTVNDRDRSPFLPQGIRVRNYLIFPEASANLLRDDNIFGTQKGQTDLRRELGATVKLESHLPRHLLDFMFSGRVVSFQDHDERNYADGLATMQARLDINRGHALVGNFLTRLDHEERRDGETPITAKRPVEFWNSEADVGFVRSVGRLSTLVGATAAHREYHAVEAFDGGKLDQRFRDTDTYTSYVKLRYQVSPGYLLTGRVSGIMEENRGTASYNRSNHGYEALAGVGFELSRLLKASLEGGYAQRDYDQAAFTDIRTAVFEGKLTWMITPLVTLYLTGRRNITSTASIGASGRIETSLVAGLEYEAWRNLIFTAGLEYVGADFGGTTRHDDLAVARLGAKYLINRNMHLTLNYEHQSLTSNLAGTGFEGNKIMAGFKIQY